MTATFETDMASGIHVLLISGSLRARSTNTSVLRTVPAVAPPGIVATVYDGLADLPHFNPDDDVDPLHPAVAALRGRIRMSDALLFSTPEYAGALPGSFKNLLDWTIGDGAAGSIYEKPVAWINASPRGAADAHQSLRLVLGYAKAFVVEAACAHNPVTAAMVGDDGLVSDPAVRAARQHPGGAQPPCRPSAPTARVMGVRRASAPGRRPLTMFRTIGTVALWLPGSSPTLS